MKKSNYRQKKVQGDTAVEPVCTAPAVMTGCAKGIFRPQALTAVAEQGYSYAKQGGTLYCKEIIRLYADIATGVPSA